MAMQRQRVVLAAMVKHGYITQQQADQARAAAFTFQPLTLA
jgi:membrane peptidoglycan carboxypeptidase